ncbi:hypothetical protein [Bradyrhizobium sp. LTSPM299]|uniref:hypothetical protein n=1 Tax=Bradyrhizobium sp. LTSPM299 TaxID=1619233 RepID=UPI000678E182|nr:hypothetical protein [Bradyrhizobium sp. LTSPM299]
MRSARIVCTLLAALGLLLGVSTAFAEFLPGTPCPDGYTCFSVIPRDGMCQHPDVVLDEEMKVTRFDGDQFSQERERACIMQTAGAVVRSGAGLHLKFDNAKSRLIKDKADCERNPDTCELYSLYDYFPKGRLFLVHDQGYESGAWFLISQRDGRRQRIVAPLGYSPNKRWLAAVNATDGPGDNGFDIVPADFNPNEAAIHYRPTAYELWEFVRWDGDNRLLLNVTVHDDSSPALATRPAEVSLVNGKWVLNKWSPR